MPMLIGGEPISPGPLVDISKQVLTAEDGSQLGQIYQITLRGNLVSVPPGGVPVPQDAKLGILLAKQNTLSAQFSENGKLFEIYSPDGSNVVKCNPKVVSINFAEGVWVDRTEYTIVLESPSLYADDFVPTENVSDVRDQWQIEEAGFTTINGGASLTPIWQLTHTVSATGKLIYEEDGSIDPERVGWKQARDWVLRKLSTSTFEGRPIDTSGELSLLPNGQAYNHTRTEDVDTISGSFSVTERWIMTQEAPAVEDYAISIRRTPEDAGISVNVTGTVRGLSTGLNQLQTRIQNAINYFEVSVKPHLVARANSAVPGITLSDYGVTGSLDYNYAEGTVTYTYDFNNKATPAGDDTVYDTYTVSRKSNIEDAETTVTVQGTIVGRLRVNEPLSFLLKYERAKIYWDNLVASGAILARANTSGVSSLKPSALQGSVDYQISEGSISYSYDFNNRQDDLARNEYTISLRSSREEARTTVSVEGSITGLRQSDTDPITAKYSNALGFWLGWEPQILGRAQQFAPGVTINPEPAGRSRGDNIRQGVINYTYEYNTDAAPTIPNALSEQITVNDTNPSDVFAATTVLGRLAGPILQAIGSKKERSRTITLEVVMKRGAPRPNTDGVIAAYRPNATQVFVDRDEESWTENTARFTRTVSWTYE